jgi:hypothetical protein
MENKKVSKGKKKESKEKRHTLLQPQRQQGCEPNIGDY